MEKPAVRLLKGLKFTTHVLLSQHIFMKCHSFHTERKDEKTDKHFYNWKKNVYGETEQICKIVGIVLNFSGHFKIALFRNAQMIMFCSVLHC